nr:hypothetical protein [Tanacetum cinerariifolium]
MYKLDSVTLALRDKNNRETHIYYLKHIMKQAAILREIAEQPKSLNPLDSASYSAYKYVKLIQELLGYVRDTCPNIHKPSKKLVFVMSTNKKKIVRFAEPIISSSTSQKQLGHIAKQCTTKKRVKDSEWFQDKMLLAQAQEARVVLNDEQKDFLADSLEETDDCDDLQL